MKILIVGGFEMFVGDGAAYWTLGPQLQAAGHTVLLRECEQTGNAAKVSMNDFLWCDAACVYSYGMSSEDDLSKGRTNPLRMLIIIAGVPDVWKGQWYGRVWNLLPFVQKARDFQVDAIPASEYIHNASQIWVNFGDPIPINQQYVNINCDSLVAQYLNPVDKHTHIQNDPALLAQVLTLLLGA